MAALRERSESMIDENPFQVANKSGTLEQIKNRVRDRVGINELGSAKRAFNIFWSQQHLKPEKWQREISFFDTEIRPLMETNYYRGIGEDGRPTDLFIKIDIWFISIFGFELLARSLYLSRRYKNLNLLDAVLLRWYDLILVFPFLVFPVLRLLRFIPVSIRVNQSGLMNLEPFRKRISRIFISQFVLELTEVVILRVIEQIQNLVRDGTLSRLIVSTDPDYQYVDINEVNELQEDLSTVILCCNL